MWWWTAGAIVLFGLILLVLAVLPLARRVGPLRAALGRLQARAVQAQSLQAGVAQLQEKATDLQVLVEASQHHASSQPSIAAKLRARLGPQ